MRPTFETLAPGRNESSTKANGMNETVRLFDISVMFLVFRSFCCDFLDPLGNQEEPMGSDR